MDELADMIGEIKRLDPKPGLRYGRIEVQHVVPDVLVARGRRQLDRRAQQRHAAPRAGQPQLFTKVTKAARSEKDKGYLVECLQTANWLAKSLDQRAHDPQGGRGDRAPAGRVPQPACSTCLNLRTVADAISMHESTVSRVTSNKYMSTPRGIFELVFLHLRDLLSSEDEAHSSEAVRHRIRQLIDGEARCCPTT